MRLIDDCLDKKVDHILTKSVSRFARNTSEFLEYTRILRKKGVSVYFEKENLDTLINTNEFFLTMLGAFAQAESESISENVKLGIRAGYKLGKVNFGYNCMMGYRRGYRGTPEIIPAEADIITRVFELYLMGYTRAGISKEIGSIKTHLRDKPYTLGSGTIQAMLRNERFCGDVVLQKRYVLDCITKKQIINNGELPMYLVSNNHPGIISRETFEKAQNEIRYRTTIIKSPGAAVGKYTILSLSSILICGDCGSTYKRVTRKNKRLSWRCRNLIDHGINCCHNPITLPEVQLHEILLERISHFLETNVSARTLLTKRICDAWGYYDDDTGINTMENTIKALSEKVTSLLSNGLKTDDERDEFQGLSDTIRIMSSQINDKHQSKVFKSKKAKIKEVKKFMAELSAGTAEFNDCYIRQIIRKIVVQSTGTLVVTYTTGDSESVDFTSEKE